MKDSRQRSPWEVPDCPGCGGHIHVDGYSQDADWRCHKCGTIFDGDLVERPAAQVERNARRVAR